MESVEAKVVIVGSQGVGKTSIAMQYTGQRFSRHVSPTIGASFFTCTVVVGLTTVKLQIWDTAGQERFRAMAPMYYRNANAALIVFDLTCQQSFAMTRHWFKEILRNIDNTVALCLIGNKSDLTTERQVSREEAVKYANVISAAYYETSALSNENLDDVFLFIALQIVNNGTNNQGIDSIEDRLHETVELPSPTKKLECVKKEDCC